MKESMSMRMIARYHDVIVPSPTLDLTFIIGSWCGRSCHGFCVLTALFAHLYWHPSTPQHGGIPSAAWPRRLNGA